MTEQINFNAIGYSPQDLNYFSTTTDDQETPGGLLISYNTTNFSIVTPPQHGNIYAFDRDKIDFSNGEVIKGSFTDLNNASFYDDIIYVADNNYSGEDSFTFKKHGVKYNMSVDVGNPDDESPNSSTNHEIINIVDNYLATNNERFHTAWDKKGCLDFAKEVAAEAGTPLPSGNTTKTFPDKSAELTDTQNANWDIFNLGQTIGDFDLMSGDILTFDWKFASFGHAAIVNDVKEDSFTLISNSEGHRNNATYIAESTRPIESPLEETLENWWNIQEHDDIEDITVYRASGVSNVTQVDLNADQEEVITTIPEGAQDVQVTLSGNADYLDLGLDAGNTQIVDWSDGLISSDGGTTTYAGAEIIWSGWSANANGNETISIDGTLDQDLTLLADAYWGGTGEVKYNWDSSNAAVDDCAADGTTSGNLPIGNTVSGTLETNNDEDWFQVDLSGDTKYKFSLSGYEGSKDPWIHIYDSGQDTIANKDSLEGDLTFTPSSDGTYYVGIQDRIGTTDLSPLDYDVTATKVSSGPEVSNTTQVDLNAGQEKIIDTIPQGAQDVQVTLSGDADASLDLALDAGNTQIVDWSDGLISGSDGGTTTYAGAEITWSGWSANANGNETLSIDGTLDQDLTLLADASFSGTGEVDYSWESSNAADESELNLLGQQIDTNSDINANVIDLA